MNVFVKRLVWGAALWLVACGPATGPDVPGGPVTELTEAEFTQRYEAGFAKALCESVFGCDVPNSDFYAIVSTYKTLDNCEQNIGSSPFFAFLLDTSGVPGTPNTTFDGAAALACVTAIEGADLCNPTVSLLTSTTACEEVVLGTVEVGGACADDLQCAGDGTCEIGDTPCEGTCVAGTPTEEPCDGMCASDELCLVAADTEACTKARSVAEGGACGTQSILCERGLQCDFGTGTCVMAPPLRARGESCAVSAFGGGGELCELGLGCIDVTFQGQMATGTCGDFKASGESCSFLGTCEGGLRCIGWEGTLTGMGSGMCGVPKAAGEACAQMSECQSGNCSEGACVANEMCL